MGGHGKQKKPPDWFQKIMDLFASFEETVAGEADRCRDRFKERFADEVAVYVTLAAAAIGMAKEGLTSPKRTTEGQSRRIRLLGQMIINLGDTYDSTSEGFYGNAAAGIRRFYEHLVHASAWRLEPETMADLSRQAKRGERQAYSIGIVQRHAGAGSGWVSAYGDMSRVVHPEGLLDELNTVPLDAHYDAYSVFPRFAPDPALGLLKLLVGEVIWLSQELAFLTQEFGTFEDMRDFQAAAGAAIEKARELGFIEAAK